MSPDLPRRLVAVALLSAAASGCVHRIHFGPLGQLTDPAELLALVERNDAAVLSLEGDGRLRLDATSGKGAVNVFVAAARPASLRVEALDFFGRPQAVLVTDGTSFGLYRADQQTYLHGPATATNLAQLVPIALPPQVLVPLLLGEVPRAASAASSLTLDAEARAYLLTLADGSRLWVHPEHHRAVAGKVGEVEARFAELRREGERVYPAKISLSAPAQAAFLELTYGDVGLNGQLDPSLFTFDPPEGVRRIALDGVGQPLPE